MGREDRGSDQTLSSCGWFFWFLNIVERVIMRKSSPLVVLTGPSTEMSDYEGSHIMAFAAGFSKPWFMPRFYLKRAFFKPVTSNSLEVELAPLGLRKLEADLVKSGFKHEDIAVVHPDNLKSAVGPETKVIGISSKDPLGLGYVSLTYSSMLNLGEPINKTEFKRLMKDAQKAKQKFGSRIAVGGAGSWQLLRPEAIDSFDIDCIFMGEGDATGPDIIQKMAKGENTPQTVEGKQASLDDISPIIRPTIYGAVEISRGCGRGCAFCSPTMQRRRVMPLDMIMREVETNVNHGQHDVLLVTEDIFMYGCNSSDFAPNSRAVDELFKTLTACEGLKSVQVTHANLAAVRADKELASRVGSVLRERSDYRLAGKQVATVEVGIETGSPKLFKKHMAGKCKPFQPEEWPSIVLSSLSFLEEQEWLALATILVGLPGETDEDAKQTAKLIENIEDQSLKTFLVPLIFVPLGTCGLREAALQSVTDLTETQAEVFALAWEHNIKIWGPDFFNSPAYKSRWAKFGFKAVSRLLYHLKYKRSDKWRRTIADRTIKALDQVV
jgi:radical SAM superfamily enzyme YgiQ (UPF0313 family)